MPTQREKGYPSTFAAGGSPLLFDTLTPFNYQNQSYMASPTGVSGNNAIFINEEGRSQVHTQEITVPSPEKSKDVHENHLF